MPKVQELQDLGAWGHNQPLILKSGRCTHYIPAGLEDEKREELENQLNEQDKTEERFKAASEDSQVGELQAWLSKISGDQTTYGENCYAVNVLSSIRWPGAMTVSKSGQYFNIYVGDTIKRGGHSFYPFEPPMVLRDPSDPEDHSNMRYVEAPKEQKPADE